MPKTLDEVLKELEKSDNLKANLKEGHADQMQSAAFVRLIHGLSRQWLVDVLKLDPGDMSAIHAFNCSTLATIFTFGVTCGLRMNELEMPKEN